MRTREHEHGQEHTSSIMEGWLGIAKARVATFDEGAKRRCYLRLAACAVNRLAGVRGYRHSQLSPCLEAAVEIWEHIEENIDKSSDLLRNTLLHQLAHEFLYQAENCVIP